MKSLEELKPLIKEKVENLNYSLYSINFKKGKEAVLEIIIDRDQPINLDDITLVSRDVSDLLDKEDFYDGAYTLDVSSLGIEKPLDIKEIGKYKDKYVTIHAINPIKGENYFTGTIINVSNESIELEYFIKGRKVKTVIEIKNIDKGNLAVKF